MKTVATLFAILAGVGLVLSIAVHLCALVDVAIFGEYVWLLHVGLFIVGLPAVLYSMKLTKFSKRADFWKAALRGCPRWMRTMTAVFFVYAIFNFSIFFLSGVTSSHLSPPPLDAVKGFSGHWMAFYAGALAILTSASRLDALPDCNIVR